MASERPFGFQRSSGEPSERNRAASSRTVLPNLWHHPAPRSPVVSFLPSWASGGEPPVRAAARERLPRHFDRDGRTLSRRADRKPETGRDDAAARELTRPQRIARGGGATSYRRDELTVEHTKRAPEGTRSSAGPPTTDAVVVAAADDLRGSRPISARTTNHAWWAGLGERWLRKAQVHQRKSRGPKRSS
jgi:hypothetical protein